MPRYYNLFMIKQILSLFLCLSILFSFVMLSFVQAQESEEEKTEETLPPLQSTPFYDGVWITRYKNNNIRTKGYHKYGRYNGIFTSWYENGQKQMEGYMIDGKKNGLWIIWGSNGS